MVYDKMSKEIFEFFAWWRRKPDLVDFLKDARERLASTLSLFNSLSHEKKLDAMVCLGLVDSPDTFNKLSRGFMSVHSMWLTMVGQRNFDDVERVVWVLSTESFVVRAPDTLGSSV